MSNDKKRLAVLTSGGDAPGMNAAIRSVVRTGIANGLEIVGIRRGYTGLLGEDFLEMGPRDVSNIIQRGGTMLRTSRCKEMHDASGQKRAAEILDRHGIQGLILIGGDGTFKGGMDLSRFWGGQIIGMPGTIDNDLSGTDFTIGYDTALNTALDAIDKIRDTAEAHERIFLVEVMGRHGGCVALNVGISVGAEEILVPETPTDLEAVCQRLMDGRKRGKTSSMVVVAEGDEAGSGQEIADKITRTCGLKVRAVILGHVQRGGSPTAADRLLATRLGAHAVDAFVQGASHVMAGEIAGKLVLTGLKETWTEKKPLDRYLLKIHEALSK